MRSRWEGRLGVHLAVPEIRFCSRLFMICGVKDSRQAEGSAIHIKG